MITAQDIREKTFEKSFSGYNMAQVDEFLDEMAAEISAIAKENTALKGKMRVLVEKVEEYRQTEDSMRLALMSAQKMGAQIEADAQAKADALLTQAKEEADRLTSAAKNGIANEEAKLAEAKKATQKFFEHMRVVCEKQIDFYQKLDGMQLVTNAPAPAPVEEAAAPAEPESPKIVSITDAPKPSTRDAEVEDAVKSIETSVEQIALQPEEAITVDTAIPEEEEEPTRLFASEEAKKKRNFDDFRFDDDI